MPRELPDDSDITLRLKHGIHTIFIFASPSWTFSKLSDELIEILRERYPNGLTYDPENIGVVEDRYKDSDIKVVYGILQDPLDAEKGWKNLKARDDDRLVGKRLNDLDLLAFAFAGPDEDENDVVFNVQLPTFRDGEFGEEQEELYE